MAEYIDREAANLALAEQGFDWDKAKQALASVPAADVAPVVRCKDCKYSYEDIDGLTCVYGPCVDCTVPEDFYCKYGGREEE